MGQWVLPPSTLMTWPVMNEASSDAMKTIALATSSERPRRSIGWTGIGHRTAITVAQTTVGLLPGVQIVGPCPLWVISGHQRADPKCPLYPSKQTFVGTSGTSASCTVLATLRAGALTVGRPPTYSPSRKRTLWVISRHKGQCASCPVYPPIADIRRMSWHFRFVPEADSSSTDVQNAHLSELFGIMNQEPAMTKTLVALVLIAGGILLVTRLVDTDKPVPARLSPPTDADQISEARRVSPSMSAPDVCNLIDPWQKCSFSKPNIMVVDPKITTQAAAASFATSSFVPSAV